MSSPEEDPLPAFKKRKIQRACDYCRRKKTRCDGPETSNNRCSNCIARRAECTYLQEPPKKHRYSRSYVEELESRLERMEKFVSTLASNADEDKKVDTRISDRRPVRPLEVLSEQSHASGSRTQSPPTSSPLTLAPTPPTSTHNSPPSEDEEVALDLELTKAMRKLSMHSQPFRYHGKSSGLVFIRSALALKNEHTTSTQPWPERHRHHPWLKDFVEDDFPVFDESVFPPGDLRDSLIELYFRRTNHHFPLLHEPTFKNAVKAGKHLCDGGFGATVLLVCAIGSRFTRDTRVLLPESNHHPHSAGWKWFRAVEKARRLSFAPAGLHDLQVYALMAMFLDGSAAAVGSWTVIGAGIRAAIEVGVHRKSMYAPTPNVEEELWRRAFWILVFLEWISGHGFGRPCSIHDEDHDLAFPTECDDEYWLMPDGKPLFEQPPNKPSVISGFVQLLKLGQSLDFANRTIYATKKSKAQLGHSDEQWEQRVVAELDSALNQWSNSLPNHLRWNPEEENELFLSQAATIAVVYYLHQIAVHRSFMSRPSSSSHRESPMAPLSTIICVNASRSAIQVIEVLYNRTGNLTAHRNMGMVFMSSIILTINMLRLKRPGGGGAADIEKDLQLVEKSVAMLRSLQYESHLSDKLADVLTDMISGITESPSPRAATNVSEPATPRGKTGIEHAPRREQPIQASAIPAPPGVALRTHPDVDFAHPTPDIQSVFHSDTFSRPSDCSIQNGATEEVPLPPAVSQSCANSLLPTQNGPQLSPSSGTSLSSATGGTGLDVLSTMPMFSTEAMSTTSQSNEWMSLHSPTAVPEGGPARHDYPPPTGHEHLAAVEDPPGQQDANASDFMLLDDTLAMWPSMSPIFGWDEWSALFTNGDNAGT